jgi:hypothetical protein
MRVVKQSDLAGPLVNTLTVETDDGMGDNNIHSATATVTLVEEFTMHLPYAEKQ